MNSLVQRKHKQRKQNILGAFGDQVIDVIEGALARTQTPSFLEKAHKIKLESAVGIVFCNGYVLIGLASADDERDGKWCFPGGGIDPGEDCMSAAIRETYEEMGITASPVTQMILTHPIKPSVGFCILSCSEMNKIECNEEFTQCKWCSISQLPDDMLSINKEILEFLKKGI